VQKLTELGVDRIVVLRAERSVVRWEGDRLTAQLERLRRVAREASMQSRRCDIPHIDGVINVGDAVGALAHFDGAPLTAAHTAVLIGPEGGWSDDEVCGRDAVSLGPTVLRAETAAVAAAVRMTALRDS
jgi:16S rRNA (uracil1498-N3)-methyltransferase